MRSSPIFRFPFGRPGKGGGNGFFVNPFSRRSESQSLGKANALQWRGEHKSSGMETTKGTMYGHDRVSEREGGRERESAREREGEREGS